MRKYYDIKNQKFGRLTPIEFVGQIKKGGPIFWKCRCDCGKVKLINGHNIRYGLSKSCGCSKKEARHAITHGLFVGLCGGNKNGKEFRFYNIYKGAKQRCTDINSHAYHKYGGRGVKLEWPDFESFREDMYGSYLEHAKEHGIKQTTLDRIDNDGNYSKDNCKWSTYKEQANNRGVNIIVKDIDGEVMTASQFAEKHNMGVQKAHARFRSGRSAEEVLNFKRKSILPRSKYITAEQIADNLYMVNSVLSDNERTVIFGRSGFLTDKKLSLAEIGNKLSLSRERIRQIEAQAIKKLAKNYESYRVKY